MSDPLGRHYCPHAKNYDDMSNACECKVSGEWQSCAGITDYCDLKDEDVLDYEAKQEHKREMKNG